MKADPNVQFQLRDSRVELKPGDHIQLEMRCPRYRADGTAWIAYRGKRFDLQGGDGEDFFIDLAKPIG